MNEDILIESTEDKVTNATEDKALLDYVVSKVEYNFTRDLLVKPLPDTMVEKEISRPKNTGVIDPEWNAQEMEVETSIETVPANFKKGIVLASPIGYQWKTQLSDGTVVDAESHPEVGDEIAYSRKGAISFDLFKDSELVNPYNVVAWIKK